MTREDLETLYKHKARAAQALDILGLANTHGLTPEQAVELDLAYERARLALEVSNKAYNEAIREYLHSEMALEAPLVRCPR